MPRSLEQSHQSVCGIFVALVKTFLRARHFKYVYINCIKLCLSLCHKRSRTRTCLQLPMHFLQLSEIEQRLRQISWALKALMQELMQGLSSNNAASVQSFLFWVSHGKFGIQWKLEAAISPCPVPITNAATQKSARTVSRATIVANGCLRWQSQDQPSEKHSNMVTGSSGSSQTLRVSLQQSQCLVCPTAPGRQESVH